MTGWLRRSRGAGGCQAGEESGADEAYAVRILDALRDEHPPAIRQHDGVHLL